MASTMAELGPVMEVPAYATVVDAVRGVAALPPGGRALLWVRRQDSRGREGVGLLLTGVHTDAGHVGIVDASAEEPRSLDAFHESEVRLIRYR
ncbi:hypothetical protein AB0D97_05060 [Streptomyces roseus]|uniref:hypothetical protein n=1 Tax=Streptomyces roseus TaxID=66430 RepID=UPI0033CED59C